MKFILYIGVFVIFLISCKKDNPIKVERIQTDTIEDMPIDTLNPNDTIGPVPTACSQVQFYVYFSGANQLCSRTNFENPSCQYFFDIIPQGFNYSAEKLRYSYYRKVGDVWELLEENVPNTINQRINKSYTDTDDRRMVLQYSCDNVNWKTYRDYTIYITDTSKTYFNEIMCGSSWFDVTNSSYQQCLDSLGMEYCNRMLSVNAYKANTDGYEHTYNTYFRTEFYKYSGTAYVLLDSRVREIKDFEIKYNEEYAVNEKGKYKIKIYNACDAFTWEEIKNFDVYF